MDSAPSQIGPLKISEKTQEDINQLKQQAAVVANDLAGDCEDSLEEAAEKCAPSILTCIVNFVCPCRKSKIA